MAEPFEEFVQPARVLHGDYVGTAAADGHRGSSLGELAATVGLDEDRYDIVGFQFAHKALRGKPGLTIFAVDREVLGTLTLAQYGSRHGEIPVVDFLVHGTPAMEILAASLKRLQVQLLSRNLPDGVPIRRTSAEDLGH